MVLHRKAALLLILATLVWGLSFPLGRAVSLAQEARMPLVSTWFLTAVTVAFRFMIAAAVMLFLVVRAGSRPTRSEWVQGLGLAAFSSSGMLFQNDGLFHTTASVSAFLTQAYCGIIPLYTALRLRRWPRGVELTAVFFVGAGVMILSGVRWNDLRLGRGEAETLISSVFYAGQILWLERPEFRGNRPLVFSAIMFSSITIILLLVARATMRQPADFFLAFNTGPILLLCGLLALVCTLLPFVLMNRWQPEVSAVEAGLIYCLEPVFASGFALFLPGWLAVCLAIPLENELFTRSLLLGGCLILAADLAMLFFPKKALPSAEKWVVRDSNPEPGD